MATRWGIAGCGKISHDFVTALNVLPKSEHVVIAVAAQDLSRAENFAATHNVKKAYDSYEKLAKDEEIDVVYVGTIHPTHLSVAQLMLSNKKHVLCEKPLTLNYKQTSQLINTAKSKNLFLMEAIWSRCFPAYDIIKKEIASGSIGEVYQVLVSFGFNLSGVDRLELKKLGGGTILDLGVYGIQFACHIFDHEVPQSVKASGCLNEEGVDISATASFHYKGNRTATMLFHSKVDLPNEAYVLGTKGMIKIPQFWSPSKLELSNGKVVDLPLPKTNLKFNFVNSVGLSYEADEVRKCILKDMIESPKVSHAASLLIAQLEDEIRKQVGVVYDDD
ncbi:trans-1,2-dihydrobenzene-1,2-diol dehydrogenase isoform X1 [Megalopta genalis]|uniref:trans-1,2-dihydrobenzene-1,2-diol dehydrogenase isoform X1 n=1 Tax=Megalopta genalis TaxID=115081 RepID=UPI001443895B|nr:trans-1,2-dihydrobenzene-1,2-diol dehydrogenase-like [Megalopta genalis]XP_033323195.1 trans-1,2-dihydrobenzene-1,2-diol dehydrogenase-like [Megalopta genalis]